MKTSFSGELSNGHFYANDAELWGKMSIKECRIDVTDLSLLKGKQKMYNYINGVLYKWAGAILRKYGHSVSDATAAAFLEDKYMKTIEDGPDGPIQYVPSQRDWTKEAMSEYIDNVILFFAETLSEEAPDAVEYISNLEKKKRYKNLTLIHRSKEDF